MAPNLLYPIHTLLQALSNDSLEMDEICEAFTTSPPPTIHEYGLPCLAPYLGRTFRGQQGVREYFELLVSVLSISHLSFDPASHWAIDDNNMVVSLRGRGFFTWLQTDMSWDETFMYRIRLARDNSQTEKRGTLLVVEYEVWADTGAAYLARIGELVDVEEEFEGHHEDDDNHLVGVGGMPMLPPGARGRIASRH